MDVSQMMMFIPEEAFAALLVLAGLLMIIGLRKIAGALVSSVLMLAVFRPFFEGLSEVIPLWVAALLLLLFGLSLVKTILGRGVYENLAAMILFSCLRLPFRLIAWVMRGGTSRGGP